MPKLSDRKDDQRFFALFVGRHNSGKTVAEASFTKPLEILDFDLQIDGAVVPFLDLKGITYESFPPKQANLIQKIDNKIVTYQEQSVLAMPGVLGSLPKTVVIDSLTSFTFAICCQSLGLTHKNGSGSEKERRGRYIGTTAMLGPEDYALESQATQSVVADFKSLPIQNVIFSGHLVDQYDKPEDEDGEKLPYAASVVTGQKLSIRDKISENVQAMVSHIFRFERKTEGGKDKFYVTFRGGIACSRYSWLPYGPQEWTGKNFYEFMHSFRDKGEKK